MSQEQWNAVDAYIESHLAPPDPALAAALEASQLAGLPQIQVSPQHGKLLALLVQTLGARNVLEIGTLGGYSSIWLARALPRDGRLITLELDPRHADVARDNLARANVGEKVEVRVGRALELLPQLQSEQRGPFDLIFIDADKASLPEYFAWSLALARAGSLIVIDNVVRRGAVIDPENTDPNVRGVRKLYELLSREPRVTATALQTVGSKGYDGIAIVRVNA